MAAVNRDHYSELARLAANLKQIAHQSNKGSRVSVSDDLLAQTANESRRLRRARLGVEEGSDDR